MTLCIKVQEFQVISVTEFRKELSKLRLKVQTGKRYAVCYYSTCIGYFVSHKVVPSTWKAESVSLHEFRDALSDCYQRLVAHELDAFLITLHGKPRAAFVGEHKKLEIEGGRDRDE